VEHFNQFHTQVASVTRMIISIDFSDVAYVMDCNNVAGHRSRRPFRLALMCCRDVKPLQWQNFPPVLGWRAIA
jgi:hypothetical protein